MHPQLRQRLGQMLDANRIASIETIQRLWSDCGQIARVRWIDAQSADGGERSAVIKHVEMPSSIDHPRGWNTDRSAKRKTESYAVETRWYRDFSARCTAACRVPSYLGDASAGDERLLVLEDIDASGFGRRVTHADARHLNACIHWLASFHATWLGQSPDGLWDKGTYWHLQTRPDEFEAMPPGPLKDAARRIDAALDASPFQTLVHGDAKLANFCFSQDPAPPPKVAAVDFQYVGGGCGMKDLAYLVGGCLDADACFREEDRILDTYFATLRDALTHRGSTIDADALESDWRRLYPYAWADFHRFLIGWSPGHWKIDAYSKAMTRKVLEA
jgi:hypothetical protein